MAGLRSEFLVDDSRLLTIRTLISPTALLSRLQLTALHDHGPLGRLDLEVELGGRDGSGQVLPSDDADDLVVQIDLKRESYA